MVPIGVLWCDLGELDRNITNQAFEQGTTTRLSEHNLLFGRSETRAVNQALEGCKTRFYGFGRIRNFSPVARLL